MFIIKEIQRYKNKQRMKKILKDNNNEANLANKME
jgi:hypothetical protein